MLKKKRKDFENKTFHNPFFEKRRQPHRKGVFFVLAGIFLIGGFLFLGYWQLHITTVTVDGTDDQVAQSIQQAATSQLTQRRFFIFPQSNLIFFNKKQLVETLKNQYQIAGVNIKKKPRSLDITVGQQPYRIILISGNTQYYLNDVGLVITEVNSQNQLSITPVGDGVELVRSGVSASAYPVVIDQSNREISIGGTALAPEKVVFITELVAAFADNRLPGITTFEIRSPAAEDLVATTRDGWYAYFSFKNSVFQQVNKLLAIINERVDDPARLEYIDLRFGEKVFYK
ncbi:MAG: hypothetical protein A2840_02255 [Candidatus Buchananbacteria bacterium RIFCSPHIGHO2_01_FULL_47_11b]|uniref:POTRA domain-containing protein n=1 Tax=Candidatus Buchananbacteria bacterium RIFCSPHIGHO2_01_FULL_47_11b TaxID=1797537 RepID=A0A1G1Y8W5_9BACT|nr:MAG: hypothetical protein A2840_02255 [Candidatus Buchananbacteria bacterium RIFCSPHIGHO2_01_FULL_47_11b]